MNALLIALGSEGDVSPLLRLGVALRGRGHQVSVVSSAYFEAAIRSAGLDPIGLGTVEDYEALTADPDLWHPSRGPPEAVSTNSA